MSSRSFSPPFKLPMPSYIDSYSWKCLLGPQSKNYQEINGLYLWDVGKKKHFATQRLLTSDDLSLLSDCSFHYLSEENLNFLLKSKKLQKDKNISTILNIQNLSFSGNKFKSIRHALNRGKSYNLTAENNYRKLQDIKDMIEEWSDVLAQKYFRDNSGKNFFFYKNNWHQNCINLFLYDQDKLVSFGSLSPSQNGYSAYILGKALCHKYYGLSEFTDVELYKKAQTTGIQWVDMGQTQKGLIHYKQKFENTTYTYFNGKIL